LALEPQFLVLDEPTSALDVSVEARVLNLLLELQEQFQLTYLFITHDAAVARYIGDRVAVMYLGRIVELGRIDEVFEEPLHPYTQALMESVLTPGTMLSGKEVLLKGAPESPIDPPEGCIFQRRCRERSNKCDRELPRLVEVHSGHFVSCVKVESETRSPTREMLGSDRRPV
jgi:oligopeptide/dipeptide ABC transporter ATP-binding protein